MGFTIAMVTIVFIGAIAAFVASEKSRGRAKKIFEALNSQGPAAARAALEEVYPNKPGVPNPERIAALAILGDIPAVERELPALTGHPQFVPQVEAVGQLALVLYGPNPEHAAVKLVEVNEKIKKVTSKLAKIPREHGDAIAHLGQALVGRAPTSAISRPILLRAAAGRLFMRLLFLEAIVRALEVAGEKDKAANAREELKLYDPLRRAA
jgi:hypothetical protein